MAVKLVKYVVPEIVQLLCHIFNQGNFTDAFKYARVVSIYKTGDKLSCSNYRSLALVETFSKILE
jgi:hypothetical protein